jgi:nicotinamide-nucleotide amidase
VNTLFTIQISHISYLNKYSHIPVNMTLLKSFIYVRLNEINENTINNFGAVSEETVKEMSEGAKSAFHSDYSIAVSGVAGPDGGTIEKPVGTVWIAVTGKTKTITKTYNFGNKRTQNIERSATTALVILYKLMKEEQVS